jgi:microcystin-dependent protein
MQFTGTFAIGNNTINATSDLRFIGIEQAVLESATPGITNLTIVSITASQIVMSGPATANSGATVTIYAYPFGNGDGVSSFQIPDRRSRVVAGHDNMGGTAANRLTAFSAFALNGVGGAETQAITVANLPNYNLSVSITDPGHTHTYTGVTGGAGLQSGSGGGGVANLTTSNHTTGISVSVNSSGGNQVFNITQPTGISNFIIKT